MKYPKLQEEELKNRVAQDFFAHCDCTAIIEKIDFAVKSKHFSKGIYPLVSEEYFLWAEAKADVADVCDMLTQLVLTIGKARTFDKITPPPFLGCFDREKIAFIPYHAVQDIFYQNDFNWKIAPSNRNSREFKQVYELIKNVLDGTRDEGRGVRDEKNLTPHPSSLTPLLFDFHKDENELKQFIRENFIVGKTDTTKIRIDKNNFTHIYHRWLETVKPTIAVNWELAKKSGIIDGDFYLADLLSRENETLKEKLFVLLRSSHYELDRQLDTAGFFTNRQAHFTDNQKAHDQFWAIYERPPLEEYWDYLTERRDLLVPQDVRERKGSFFTPRIWVELSQKYIADVLGENWQDEYYVWDCAAGTGNLLTGLTNKYNIWASTIDKADVDVMHDRIENGANLLKDHVFQFDFLNDDFDKLPKSLRDIINDENRRKKLIIYINPPYADASSNMKTGKKAGNSDTRIRELYKNQLGAFARELYAQFLTRIYKEMPDCKIGIFSKLHLFAVNHAKKMQEWWHAKFEKGFLMPAISFDNVKGQFPIAFQIWDTEVKKSIRASRFDVYDQNKTLIGKKKVLNFNKFAKINEWLVECCPPKLNGNGNGNGSIGFLSRGRNDFSNNGVMFIVNSKAKATNSYSIINQNTLIVCAVYLAVQKVIPADWLNDRDQFLYPNDGWKADKEFRNDCLTYALFHGSNNIQSEHGINHWIPFTESEVNARSKFESNFMTDFITGKIEYTNDLFTNGKKRKKLVFSPEAKAVFRAGKKLWTYYHSQPKCNVNASLYDIREHFQGRNASGKMNNKSTDETYNALIADLRAALKSLAAKIEPKVYEYGFLMK